jgi:uncharacterized repeat protein (TIGR03943 family)
MIRDLLLVLTRRRHGLVFVAWAGILLWLVRTEGYRSFVAPAFGTLLAVTYVGLLVLLFAETYGSRPREQPIARLVSALTLLVPVLFLAHAQGARLNGYALTRRMVGLPTTTPPPTSASARPPSPAAAREQERIASMPDEVPASFMPPAPEAPPPLDARSDAASGPIEEVTLREIFNRPHSLVGKRVAVVGMARSHEDARREFGERALIVFRFVVSCCAADARPVSVVAIRAQRQAVVPDDAWVRAEGVFRLRDTSQGIIPVLEGAWLGAMPEPRSPYL